MLIHGRQSSEPPPYLTDVERLTTMKVLGVTLRDDLNASTHITEILAECFHVCTPHIMISWTTNAMMLQELTPWLNLCMLLRLGGALFGLSTGYASTVSTEELV